MSDMWPELFTCPDCGNTLQGQYQRQHRFVCEGRPVLTDSKGLLREDKTGKVDYTYLGLMRAAVSRICSRLELGAEKYSRANWRACEDPQTYKESALRHLLQYLEGQTDEDHLGAAGTNILILLDLEEQDAVRKGE